jgi:hypothetical protein
LVAMGLLAVPTAANASLVSFDNTGGSLNCFEGANCQQFLQDIGVPVPPNGFAPFSVRFTIDTSAPVGPRPTTLPMYDGPYAAASMQPLNVYQINQPGTGLSITIGNLTLFSSNFYVAIGRITTLTEALDTIDIFSGDFFGADNLSYFFNFGNQASSLVAAPDFSNYTLPELASVNLDNFGGRSFNPASVAGGVRLQGSWTATGGGGYIHRVPEPGSLALLGLGLAGLGFMRRRKAA